MMRSIRGDAFHEPGAIAKIDEQMVVAGDRPGFRSRGRHAGGVSLGSSSRPGVRRTRTRRGRQRSGRPGHSGRPDAEFALLQGPALHVFAGRRVCRLGRVTGPRPVASGGRLQRNTRLACRDRAASVRMAPGPDRGTHRGVLLGLCLLQHRVGGHLAGRLALPRPRLPTDRPASGRSHDPTSRPASHSSSWPSSSRRFEDNRQPTPSRGVFVRGSSAP
jgi:hypothetical protein